MFNSSEAYGRSFDADAWKPYGMSDAVKGQEGFGMVKDNLEGHQREMQFAGDALTQYGQVAMAKQNYETDKQISGMLQDQQSGGGGFGLGDALGIFKTGIGIAGALCDMRLKEDVSPMFTTGQVNDKLAAMALSVHHLRDVCS